MTIAGEWNITVYTASPGQPFMLSSSKVVVQNSSYTTTRTGRCILTGLRPATTYRYRILFIPSNNEVGASNHPTSEAAKDSVRDESIVRSGEFQTFPGKGQRSEFAFNFGSCLSPGLVPMLPLASFLSQPMAFFLLIVRASHPPHLQFGADFTLTRKRIDPALRNRCCSARTHKHTHTNTHNARTRSQPPHRARAHTG